MTLVVISHYWGQHVSKEAAAVAMKVARTPLLPACLSIPPQSGTSFLASSNMASLKASVFLVSGAHTYA